MFEASWTPREEETVLHAFFEHGTRWSLVAHSLPGRTATQVKNLWHGKLRRKKSRTPSLLGDFARQYAAINQTMGHAQACAEAYAFAQQRMSESRRHTGRVRGREPGAGHPHQAEAAVEGGTPEHGAQRNPRHTDHGGSALGNAAAAGAPWYASESPDGGSADSWVGAGASYGPDVMDPFASLQGSGGGGGYSEDRMAGGASRQAGGYKEAAGLYADLQGWQDRGLGPGVTARRGVAPGSIQSFTSQPDAPMEDCALLPPGPVPPADAWGPAADSPMAAGRGFEDAWGGGLAPLRAPPAMSPPRPPPRRKGNMRAPVAWEGGGNFGGRRGLAAGTSLEGWAGAADGASLMAPGPPPPQLAAMKASPPPDLNPAWGSDRPLHRGLAPLPGGGVLRASAHSAEEAYGGAAEGSRWAGGPAFDRLLPAHGGGAGGASGRVRARTQPQQPTLESGAEFEPPGSATKVRRSAPHRGFYGEDPLPPFGLRLEGASQQLDGWQHLQGAPSMRPPEPQWAPPQDLRGSGPASFQPQVVGGSMANRISAPEKWFDLQAAHAQHDWARLQEHADAAPLFREPAPGTRGQAVGLMGPPPPRARSFEPTGPPAGDWAHRQGLRGRSVEEGRLQAGRGMQQQQQQQPGQLVYPHGAVPLVVNEDSPGQWPSRGGPLPQPFPLLSARERRAEYRRAAAEGYTIRAPWELWDDVDTSSDEEDGEAGAASSESWLDRALEGEEEDVQNVPTTGAPRRPSNWPGGVVDLCTTVRLTPPPDGRVPNSLRSINSKPPGWRERCEEAHAHKGGGLWGLWAAGKLRA
ncbi:hypothetical protein HYH03_018283 [Edaphochlamys debaryana]|uniref:Uncharacterized protein n=1 Tax=Edaphochlamys debaryana TaxID=47281 RepID=A0A835XEW4_9CHLO|nr:hypothetical protein HYH03_018283 [Edaphochlamys debaryana]|eukprot:KAG2482793.1 hypothetical protein HYH03_018283 [Edaphochlamys debaryana]